MNTVRTLMEIEKNKKLPTEVRELRIKITNEKFLTKNNGTDF